MNEISGADVKDIKPAAPENYRNIKPETEISVKELNAGVKEEFNKASEETSVYNGNEQKEYLDDNGLKYREGDRLLPNTSFERRGYKYETDSNGRIISAEGKLRIRDAEYSRDMEDVKTIHGQEYKEGDQRGHLIAHQFDGSDRLENLVPMEGKLNQGDFAKLENTLAEAVKDNADVRLKVEPVYEGDSNRPTEFRISYSIDGDKEVVVFKNGGEGKS